MKDNLAKLLDRLPIGTLIPMEVPQKHFSTKKWWRKSSLHIWREPSKDWKIRYENPQTRVNMKSTTGKTLEEATRKMITYLEEQGLIQPAK